MSQDRQIAEKLQDLLQLQVRASCEDVQKSQDHEANQNRSLNLQNLNSLALFPRMSIERGIPLSKNMLSEDVLLRQPDKSNSSSFSGEESEDIEVHNPPPIIEENEWFAEELHLNLPTFMRYKRYGENTKNVLRNFGNAQNQYALYNKGAIRIVQEEVTKPEKFNTWVRSLKLQNFDGFKSAWNQKDSNQNRLYQRLYKKICWTFYTEYAIPYVLSSRMKDRKTKISHLKYVYRFLEGIKNPEDFSYFKKIEK